MIAVFVVDFAQDAIHITAVTTGYLVMALAVLGVLLLAILDLSRMVTTDFDSPEDDTGPSALVEDRDFLESNASLTFEPEPQMRLDWSVGPPASESEVRDAMAALDLAGLYAHPLPQSPHTAFRDSWKWSSKVVGVWTQQPELVLEAGERREQVQADLTGWDIEDGKQLIGTADWDGDAR